MKRSTLAALAAMSPLFAACSEESRPFAPPPEALFSCAFGETISLSVGEIAQLEGVEGQELCLEADDAGASYVAVPFNAADRGATRLAVQVSGAGEGSGPAASRSPAGALVARGTDMAGAGVLGTPGLTHDEGFHLRLRQAEARLLGPRMGEVRGAMAAARPGISAARVPDGVADVPVVGEQLELNVSTSCDRAELRSGRVQYVSRTAVVVSDLDNPSGGFSAEDYRFFGEVMDTLIYPVDTQNFGQPTDLDENGRVIIFFTAAVNALTPPNSGSFVGGFFWGGDLLPRVLNGETYCPASNVSEMFYMLVPDPSGEVNNNIRSTQFVRRLTPGVIAHEFQHLINASRRLYVNPAENLEAVWLNEGLSHIAEELVFYAASGMQPRQNITLEMLQASQGRLDAANAYMISNLGRFITYLEDPEEESLMGIDNLPTRGAVWAFLRYAADQEQGDDRDFFFDLVNSTTAGVANLAQVMAGDPIDRMQDWTVSNYTDDLGGLAVADSYTQPSWNFRSVLPALTGGAYPLEVTTAPAGTGRRFTLEGGGATFVGFDLDAVTRGLLHVEATTASSADRLRVSLLRVR